MQKCHDDGPDIRFMPARSVFGLGESAEKCVLSHYTFSKWFLYLFTQNGQASFLTSITLSIFAPSFHPKLPKAM